MQKKLHRFHHFSFYHHMIFNQTDPINNWDYSTLKGA